MRPKVPLPPDVVHAGRSYIDQWLNANSPFAPMCEVNFPATMPKAGVTGYQANHSPSGPSACPYLPEHSEHTSLVCELRES
jgi:hypothetical protein